MDFSSFQERQTDDADVSSCVLFTAQHANSIWYVVWLSANQISQNTHGIYLLPTRISSSQGQGF